MPQTQAPQLALHVCDIRLGGGPRVRSCLDRVLFRREAVGVISQCVQHVLAQHAVETCVDVRRNVAQGVANVQADARWIGEHILDKDPIVGKIRTSIAGG